MIYTFVRVSLSVYVYGCRHMCMNMIVQVCPYVHILCLCVLYDYVQRCEDTVSVGLHYIN